MLHWAVACGRSFWADLTLSEVSGSLGDLGTFLPLVVALVKSNGLDLGTTLIFTGAYNILTGLYFRVPMPVQPMKMIAAAAIAGPLALPEVMAAGVFVSAAVLLLGATRMMGLAQSLMPGCVITGMQLGLGLGLARKGWQQVWYADGRSAPARAWWGGEGLCVGILALLFILLTVYTKQDGGPGPQQQRSLLLTAATPCSSRQPGHAGQQAPEAYTDIPAEGADGGEEAKLLDDSPALDAAAASLLAGPGLRVFGNGAGSGSSRGSGVGGSGGGKGHDPSLVGLEPPGSGHDGCRGLHSPAQLQLSIPAGWEAPVSAAGHSSSQQGWWGGAAGCHSWLQARLGWLEARMAESVGGDTPLPGSEQGTAARGAAGHGGCGAGLAPGRGLHVPSALLLVVAGVAMALVSDPAILRSLHLGPSRPQILLPNGEQWRRGILQAGLPQLPLTTFNSVVAVCQLAGDLFPDRPASPNAVAASVGAMNLVGGWFGAMPCCMGAGGLAAQARFGARTGAAPVFLGLLKVTLGLLLGSSLFQLLQAFPQPLLGAMLVYAGVQLAACARKQRGERGVAVMLLTATVVLAMGNVAVGVAAGLVAAYSLLAADALRSWVARRQRTPE